LQLFDCHYRVGIDKNQLEEKRPEKQSLEKKTDKLLFEK
jgi:hypothetical protein